MENQVNYALLAEQIDALMETDPDKIPVLANASALLMDTLPRINWAGFYLLRGDMLVLGPFQGKPACIHIKVGSGVCGTAVRDRKTQRVPDVHAFPGHIACDSASRSEIVIPLFRPNGEIFGVLDIDSPDLDRFTPEDEEGLKSFAKRIEARIVV